MKQERKNTRIVARIIRVVEKAWFSPLLHFADTQSAQRSPWAGFTNAHTAPSRKFGFTLAEVLITLGIIGVVAAMTLPALLAKTKEKEAVAKLKKVHVTLESAYRLAQNENSEVENWFSTDDIKVNSEIFYQKLKPYLKVMKDCGYKEGCLTSGRVKMLNGGAYNEYDKNTREYKIVLADGTALMFYIENYQCSGVISDVVWNACGNIKVDIDGQKGEYTFGKDFFVFDITSKGIVPSGLERDTIYPFEDNCKTSGSGFGCTAWVLYNENMDYLHCNDLSWEGKKTCK